MRIAFLTTEYPTESTFAGGIASNTARTARLLRAHGHDIEIFTLSSQRETLVHDDILVHRVPNAEWVENVVRRTPLLSRYQGYAKVLSRSWPVATALRKRHRERPFALVQAVSNQAYGLVASYRRVAPLVTFVAGCLPACRLAEGRRKTPQAKQREWAEIVQMRRSDAVHAPSRVATGYLQEWEGIPVELIEYAYSFEHIAGRQWTPVDGYPSNGYGMFFGKLSILKGCDRLVAVLKRLLPRYPDLRFVFIGDNSRAPSGQLFDQFISDELGSFQGQIMVLPPQPLEQLFRYVGHARFVVMPSRMDNLPNAVLEAMELRRVIVATRDASFEQVLADGVSGFLVSQDDDGELASAMERAWCLSDSERQRMGEAAHGVLERFKSPKAIQRLESFYQDVVHRQTLRTVTT